MNYHQKGIGKHSLPGSLIIPHTQYHSTTNLDTFWLWLGLGLWWELGLVVKVGHCMVPDVCRESKIPAQALHE